MRRKTADAPAEITPELQLAALAFRHNWSVAELKIALRRSHEHVYQLRDKINAAREYYGDRDAS